MVGKVDFFLQMEDLEEFQCGYCRETFEITDDLIEHVEQNHSDNEQSSIESEEEESHFDVIFTSNEIPIQDSPIDTYECYPCQIKFKREADLASHIQTEHGDDDVDEDEQEKSSTKGKWTCSKCEKSFLLWMFPRIFQIHSSNFGFIKSITPSRPRTIPIIGLF